MIALDRYAIETSIKYVQFYLLFVLIGNYRERLHPLYIYCPIGDNFKLRRIKLHTNKNETKLL